MILSKVLVSEADTWELFTKYVISIICRFVKFGRDCQWLPRIVGVLLN